MIRPHFRGVALTSAPSDPRTTAGPERSAPNAPVLVALCGTVLALSGPGQTAGISVFVDHIIADLEMSRSAVSTAYMIGTFAGALALPWIGRAVDRFGVRRMMAAIAVTFAVFLVVLSLAQEIVGLTAGFVGVRTMGQGGMTLVATTAVGIAVTRKRGTALGVTGAIGTAGISLVPLGAQWLIAEIGWRGAFVAEALVVCAIAVPIAVWGMRGVRRVPEEGEEEGETGAAPQWPMRAVTRTSMFWMIAGSVACSGLVGTAVMFHQIALLGEQGLTPVQAAAVFLPTTLAGLGASFLFSAATDRFSPKLLMCLTMAVHAVTLAMLPLVSPGISVILYGAALGASTAGARAIEAAAFPFYYGTKTLGALRGLTQSIAVASTAVAPLMLSVGHDLLGSYSSAVLLLAVLPAVFAVAAPFARVPRRP